jgi:PAS domain S-box-containing protein
MPIDHEVLKSLKNNNISLISIDLSYQALNLSDIQTLIETLKGNKQLKTLNLTGNQIGDEGAILLATYLNCRNLILSGTGIGETGCASLAKHPNITYLDLSYNKITDNAAREFANNTKIETLNLCGNKVACQGVIALARNKTLRSLNLMENHLTDGSVICLAQNSSLTTLNLAVNQVTNAGAVSLANNSTLTSLVLHHNKIDKEGAKAFGKNTKLLSLDLSYNKLGVEGAVNLSQNTTLTFLDLSQNFINNVGISSLLKNHKLKNLNLSYNQICDDGLCDLVDNKNLESLNISYNLMGPKTSVILAKHPNLRILELDYNEINDEGAVALAGSPSLEWLSLIGNHLGPVAAEAFANNKKLKVLVLSTNFLGDKGAIALSKNKTLVELLLSYNQIKDEGAIALAQNQTLEVLNLNYNYIQEKGRKALMENKNLKSLLLTSEPPPEFTPQNLSSLIVLSQDFICILGTNGNIQFFNPHFARVLGYHTDELLNKPFNNLLHPVDKKFWNFPANKLDQFPTLLPGYRYVCKDGSYRWIQWNCQFKNGHIYASGVDITEQKIYQEQIIEEERKKVEDHVKKQTDFIAHLCHEIRNPLNGIFGSLEAIQENIRNLEIFLNEKTPLLPSGVLEITKQTCTLINANLQDIEICAEYEKNILNDNLDIVRIAENKLQLVNEPVDIKKTLNEVCRMFKAELDKKGLMLDLKLPNEELKIKGDNLRIKQIVTNLIINAIKFTEKGRIDIFLNIKSKTPSEMQLEINVRDTGVGLDEQELNKLFERFSQAVTSAHKYGGSGLGLVISKQLAILMGGDIIVESKKGKGSIFRCVFWCEKLQVQAENKNDLMTKNHVPAPFLPLYSSSEPIRNPKILVVDDVDINRKLLINNLQKANCSCLEATNGEEAIKIFMANHEIGIIFMDIMMPGIDGLETTRRIRSYEKEKQIPSTFIIGVSGNAMESQVKEALQTGMNSYITKPYKKEEIFKLISDWRPLVTVQAVTATPATDKDLPKPK